MTLDETLASLFGTAFTVDERPDGIVLGEGRLGGTTPVALIGIVNGMPLGVEGALLLAQRVLTLARAAEPRPIVLLIDCDSQRMSRRDELLGLNECLGHLSKALLLVDRSGLPTIALLYGGGAAGALIATALAVRALVALPGAHPAVMDLPSMSRVTKLTLDTLERMSLDTPVFAPGLANLQRMGAICETWTTRSQSLGSQLASLLQRFSQLPEDARDREGERLGGRGRAAQVAQQVMQQALQQAQQQAIRRD
jgi:malonate decarboxylase gamma subunit